MTPAERHAERLRLMARVQTDPESKTARAYLAGADALEEVEKLKARVAEGVGFREVCARVFRDGGQVLDRVGTAHALAHVDNEIVELRQRVAELEVESINRFRVMKERGEMMMHLEMRANQAKADLAASRAREERLRKACAAPESCEDHAGNVCDWCEGCQAGKRGIEARRAALAEAGDL